jgi:hypothetical protein
MFERATRNDILGMTIAVSVAPIIQCYWETSTPFRDWVESFIRTSFEFVAISRASAKYNNRRIRIVLFLESLYQLDVPCLTRLIASYYSTLVSSGVLPDWPLAFHSNLEWDMDYEREVKTHIARGYDIKRVLENLLLPDEGKVKQKTRVKIGGLTAKKGPVIASPLVAKPKKGSCGPQLSQRAAKIAASRSLALRPRMSGK